MMGAVVGGSIDDGRSCWWIDRSWAQFLADRSMMGVVVGGSIDDGRSCWPIDRWWLTQYLADRSMMGSVVGGSIDGGSRNTCPIDRSVTFMHAANEKLLISRNSHFTAFGRFLSAICSIQDCDDRDQC
jgi:hypothetical protein